MSILKKPVAIIVLLVFVLSTILLPLSGLEKIYAENVDNLSELKSDVKKEEINLILQVGKTTFIKNGETLDLDPLTEVGPTIIENRVMVPLRGVVEALGGNITWDASEYKAYAILNDKSISLWIGKNTYLVGNEQKTMDIKPQIVNGRVLLPVRFALEALGCNIVWDSTNYKIFINYTYGISTPIKNTNTPTPKTIRTSTNTPTKAPTNTPTNTPTSTSKPTEPPEIDKIRVACIGSSGTYGAGTSNPATKSYPARLQALLGDKYEVKNFGQSGATMLKKGDVPYWNVPAYKNSLNYKPNIVIIMLGGNDSKPQNWKFKNEFQDNYIEMINEYKKLTSHPKVYVNTQTAVYNGTKGNFGITEPVILNEVIPRTRNAASLSNSEIIDVHSATLNMPNNFPDFVHGNDEGALVIAKTVYNALTRKENKAKIEAGAYKIISKNTGFVLDSNGVSKDLGRNVIQLAYNSTLNQIWKLTESNDGYYKINVMQTGLSLDVDGGQLNDGVNINTWGSNSSAAQLWYFEDVGDGYVKIVSKISKKVLDVSAASKLPTTKVIQWNYVGTDNQKWKLEKVDLNNNILNGIKREDLTDEISKEIREKAMNSFNNEFFTVADGKGMYKGDSKGGIPGYWGVAEMIEMVEDSYENTGNGIYKNMIHELYNGFTKQWGNDWMWNEFNDDIMWMVIACLRAYEITGDAKYKERAKYHFDKVYERGHDNVQGGGIYWKTEKKGKNTCITAPAAIAAAKLYVIYKEQGYLDKSKSLFNWVRTKLYNEETGAVHDNISNEGKVQEWNFSYNSGTFIGAANLLYKITGDKAYYNYGLKALDFTKNRLTHNYILNGGTGDGGGFNGIFARWAAKFVKENNLHAYTPWFRQNANTAWANRNSHNIMNTKDWKVKTEEGTMNSFDSSSGVALIQVCP